MYPEYQQEFSNDIQHDLTFNMREGYEADQEESDMNGPSLALPSISEDDENQMDTEHAGSPRTAALLRSPLLLKSPRRKFLQRESLATLRERVERQRSVTVKSDEFAETDSKSLDGLNLEKSSSCQDMAGVGSKQFDRLDSLHQDVAALSIEVRNAIQALQEMTYSRLASTAQLSQFAPARSIPNNLGNVVEMAISSDIVRCSSHPAEMWGREMAMFAMHPDNPFQADIVAVQKNVFPAVVNSVATQTEDVAKNELQSTDLNRIVEQTILANPDLLLVLLRKHDHLSQSTQMRKWAVEVVEREDSNGSRLDGSGGRPRSWHKSVEGGKSTSIINNSVQYYEEAEQKLLSVKNKLRRKLSTEKVRRRNNYNDSSRSNGLPDRFRFSAGDADLADPEGVRPANQSTRSLKDN